MFRTASRWRFVVLAALVPACSAPNDQSSKSIPQAGSQSNADGPATTARPGGAAERHRQLETRYLADIRCKSQVEQILDGARGLGDANRRYAATREWAVLGGRNKDGSISLVSPTTLPGLWTIVTRHSNREAVVQRVTARFTTEFTFGVDASDPARDSCEVHRNSNKAVRRFDEAAMARALTDHEILELVKKNPIGVIYVWSPHMPFSYSSELEAKGANGLKNIKEAVAQVSQELGQEVALTVAVDPTAQQPLVDAIIQREPLLDESMGQPMQALELVYRNVNHHYPAVLVYADGMISRYVHPGVEIDGKYVSVIKKRLEELRAARAALVERGAAR
jgi:hypothetical protein